MDQDIIQATKWKFRKLQLQNMITVKEMHKEKCASEILKKIDLLQEITWIKKHGTPPHLKLFKNASNNVISKQKMKVKTVGLFLFYKYAQMLLIATILPSYQIITRNAMRCNNQDDLLHLSFTLKISISSEAYI